MTDEPNFCAPDYSAFARQVALDFAKANGVGVCQHCCEVLAGRRWECEGKTYCSDACMRDEVPEPIAFQVEMDCGGPLSLWDHAGNKRDPRTVYCHD